MQGLTGTTALSRLVSEELGETLGLVVDTIKESLGFGVVVINLVDEVDDSMFVAAVHGPDDVRELLLDRRQGLQGWGELMEQSEPWGRLRFLDHRTAVGDPEDMFTWRPTMEVSDDPDAWHPDDALFAPLLGSDGRRLGMLSVDVPHDGRRPGPITRRALEAFAVTASLALQHAQLAEERASLLRHFQAVFDSSPVAIGILDEQRRYLRVNAAYSRFLGREPEQLVGHDPREFTHPEDLDVVVDLPGRDPGAPVVPAEKRYVRPDGTVVWGRLHLAPLPDGHSRGALLAQVEDITERKQAELRLTRQAHHDALTGLPNRLGCLQALRRVLEDRRAGSGVAVLFCDLDRLKLVNDAHGHAVGDAYLREVSRRLAAAVRAEDVVGRLSGDEFVVLAPGTASATDAVALAQRVVDRVREPLRLAGLDFTPSLSIGIALADDDALTPDALLARADAAMYDAKVQDRGSWHVWTGDAGHSPAEQLQLRAELGRALAEGELVLHYQPIVDLASRRTHAHEALLRWQHPRRGLLAPGQFLDVVVDSEFEAPVTDWVLRQACRDAVRRPLSERRVSVNVSSVQVSRSDLPQVVAAALRDSGLEPEHLVLELTEDRLLSRADGPALLRALTALGVTLAIDDYGTGFAGLSYLERFDAVGALKLDRSFTAALGEKPAAEHVVRSVVALAQGCGLALVAEGVETDEQARLLQDCGVRHAQGYLFSRPVPFVDAALAARTA